MVNMSIASEASNDFAAIASTHARLHVGVRVGRGEPRRLHCHEAGDGRARLRDLAVGEGLGDELANEPSRFAVWAPIALTLAMANLAKRLIEQLTT